jgi:hypothetical protein
MSNSLIRANTTSLDLTQTSFKSPMVWVNHLQRLQNRISH